MHHTPQIATSDELAERRRKREIEVTAKRLADAQDHHDRRNHRFDHFRKVCRGLGLSPQDTARVCFADPSIEADLWADLQQRIHDRRFAAGIGPFVSARPKPAPVPRRKVTPLPGSQGIEPAIDYIRTIEAIDYLEPIAGVEPLPRGRVQCPWPDHEDRHPSATFTGTVFYCHACSRGGDLIALAEAVSGIPAQGRDFIELSRWIASCLKSHAALGSVAA